MVLFVCLYNIVIAKNNKREKSSERNVTSGILCVVTLSNNCIHVFFVILPTNELTNGFFPAVKKPCVASLIVP